MNTVFLAFGYKRREDRDLAAQVEQLLASHNVRVTSGARLGGDALTPAIMRHIEACDGLVALLTRREDGEARDGTHPWVLDELGHARSKGKRTIALVEDGVVIRGAYAENERIQYDPQNPLPAFLALSDTVYEWKEEDGRRLPVKLLPPELSSTILQGNGVVECRHRLNLEGRYTEWKSVEAVPGPGGALVYIEGVKDGHTIQLEVREPNATWLSEVTPQLVQVQLVRRG